MKRKNKISTLVLMAALWMPLSNTFAQQNQWQKISAATIGGDTVCNAYGGGFTYQFPRPTLFDLDKDGDLDFFFTYGNRITYMENTGTSENPCWIVITNNFANIYLNGLSSPTFADMNGDSLADIVTYSDSVSSFFLTCYIF